MVITWFDVYTDINECEEYHELCEQNCTNTVGSYGCECSAGYSLNEDEHNCDGMLIIATCCLLLYWCCNYMQTLMSVKQALMGVIISVLM